MTIANTSNAINFVHAPSLSDYYLFYFNILSKK